MIVDLLILVLVLVVVGLVPVAMMAGLFALVDHLSDEQKLREIRQASREGRPVDFSETDTPSDDTEETLQVVEPPSGLDSQPADGDVERPHTRTDSATICPSCGQANDIEFDRCWNCQATL